MSDEIRQINLLDSIYGSYVRKEKLEQLVFETYSNSSIQGATELNVFIDINSVIHALYSEHNRIVYNNITDVSSGIINLCAHYRSYFRTISVETRFFLINTLNTCDINMKIYPDYNAVFYRKTQITKTNKLINNNMSLLKILCPYLPGIYYVESQQQFESAVIMAHIIEKINKPIPNLIISRDIYPLQLCALYPYTSYLRPIKGRGVDKSWMLPINEKYNFREEFWKKVAETRLFKTGNINNISPVNFALFMALTKMPERNLIGITSPSMAIKFIESIVGSDDIKVLSEQFISNPELANKYPVANIDSRYKVLDIQYMLPFYRNSPESKEIKFLDLEDAPTVNKISAKYYQSNPLELQKL